MRGILKDISLELLLLTLNDLVIVKRNLIRGMERCRDSQGNQFGGALDAYEDLKDWFFGGEGVLTFSSACGFWGIDEDKLRAQVVCRIMQANTLEEIAEIKAGCLSEIKKFVK